MTEKQSLIDAITLKFAEEYNLPIKSIKANLTELLQHYHVTIGDELSFDNLSTESLLEQFKNGKRSVGMKDKTLKQYEIAIATLEKYIQKPFFDAEPGDIQNFLKDYGKAVSSVTVKAKYQLLSSVFNYLFQRQMIPYNPIMHIDSPKATVIYKQPMTSIDLEKIKNACENLKEKESVRDTAIIYTFISTGCRVSELANIKIGDVDFENKTVKVLGKGRKERPVVLNDVAIYRLYKYLETRKNKSFNTPLFASIRGKEKAVSKDGIERVIKKITTLAGVDKITCHSFRRYYATELRRRNVSIQMIANSLGHANLNQINRYSLYSSQEMLDSIRQCM